MQSRTVFRVPHTCRVIKSPGYARNMSIIPTHPFFGSGRSWGGELAPLFRLMDEPSFPFVGPLAGHQHRLQPNFSYSPRFDVREVEDKYELRGELPGVEAANLQVEFTDENTLVIRGRTEREYTSGTPPATTDKAVEGAASEGVEMTKAVPAETEADDNASTYSTGSYQKPSVADGEEVGEAVATPAESVATAEAAPAAEAETTKTTEAAENTESKTEQPQPPSRYWVSERSTGSFQRTFNFPNRVDQDAVTASLKNGILSIVVPKLAAPAAKRITVE